jgi:hypothetical protein
MVRRGEHSRVGQGAPLSSSLPLAPPALTRRAGAADSCAAVGAADEEAIVLLRKVTGVL